MQSLGAILLGSSKLSLAPHVVMTVVDLGQSSEKSIPQSFIFV